MNLCQITSLIGLLIIMNFVNSKKVEQEIANPLRIVSNSIHKFSSQLYQINSIKEVSNFVSSPLSLNIVLSMTAYGAGGDTEKQIRAGLNLPDDNALVKRGLLLLIGALKNTSKVTLRLAQKTYVAKNLEVKSKFKDTAKNYFQSPVESLDFTETHKASLVINNWTANQTNNYVKKIINADDLKDAALVLVNTIYFKGDWMLPFASKDTRLHPFHIDEHTMKDVEMMNQKSWFNYGSLPELDAHYIELLYENDKEEEATSMIIFLPDKSNGLKRVQRSLEKVNFEELHGRRYKTKLDLKIPKFKVESSPQLQPTLEKMGMTDMFLDIANFTGITDSPLKVSKVVQKAVIGVTERGTTASAATVLVAQFRSTPIREDITPFTVDHPFIFSIYHAPTKTVLFQGHVTVPYAP